MKVGPRTQPVSNKLTFKDLDIGDKFIYKDSTYGWLYHQIHQKIDDADAQYTSDIFSKPGRWAPGSDRLVKRVTNIEVVYVIED